MRVTQEAAEAEEEAVAAVGRRRPGAGAIAVDGVVVVVGAVAAALLGTAPKNDFMVTCGLRARELSLVDGRHRVDVHRRATAPGLPLE